MPAEHTIPYGDTGITALVRPGNPVVVFSHGFGVQRDSRGLFTEIADALPESYGYVLFDYNVVAELDGVKHVHLRSYDEQTQVLRSVLDYVRRELEASEIHLIGHSMGSVTIALTHDPDVDKILLLAPPVDTSSGRSYFTSYPGAERQEGGITVIPRKDGSVTHVSDTFWDKAEAIFPPDVITAYAKTHPVVVVQALDEDVLKNTQNYSLFEDRPNIQLHTLPGNHNFDAPNRTPLTSLVLELLA